MAYLMQASFQGQYNFKRDAVQDCHWLFGLLRCLALVLLSTGSSWYLRQLQSLTKPFDQPKNTLGLGNSHMLPSFKVVAATHPHSCIDETISPPLLPPFTCSSFIKQSRKLLKVMKNSGCCPPKFSKWRWRERGGDNSQNLGRANPMTLRMKSCTPVTVPPAEHAAFSATNSCA